MPIEDARTLRTEGQDALRAGDYSEARRKFGRVLDLASSSSNVYRDAEKYMRHLGDDDEAEPFRLLMQIRQERDARQRVDLLTQALARGLEFALPDEQNLVELLEQAKATLRDEQGRKALDLMEQGDTARERGDLERAHELYRQARDVPDVESDLRKTIRKRLEKIESAIQQEAQLVALLRQAGEALSESRYAGALDKLEQASQLRPGDQRLEAPTRRAREGVKVVETIERLLAQAQEKEDGEPWQAVELYDQAHTQAQMFVLQPLGEKAEAGKTRAQGRVEERATQADGLVQQALEAFAQKNLSHALQCYEDALTTDRRNEVAQQGKAQVERRLKDIEEAEALKGEGQRLGTRNKDWAAAIQSLRQAQEKNPGDPELERLLRDAERARADIESVLDTVKLQRLPYLTPSEMQSALGKIAPDMKTEVWDDISRRTRQLFRLEATLKLQEYYVKPTAALVEAGDFAAAAERCQQSDEEWQAYLDKEAKDILALRSRLTILRAYRSDLELASQAWDRLQSANARAEQAQADGRYEEAANAIREVLLGLEASSPKAHYLLGRQDSPDGVTFTGVWESSRMRFLEAARRLARQWETPLHQTLRRAETGLNTGDPEGVLAIIEEARKQADELRRVKVEHDNIQAVGWPLAEPLWETVAALKKQVDDAVRVNRLVAAAREHLSKGELDEAEACYTEAKDIQPGSRRVAAGLQGVAHLRALVVQYEEAARKRDLDVQRDTLAEIVRLASRWEWADARLREVKGELEQERQLDALRSNARLAMDHRDPDMARKLAQQVLEVRPDDDEMQQISAWADVYKTQKDERKEWKEQARSAMRACEFHDVLDHVAKVLEQDKGDVEAKRLGERAQGALDCMEEARRLMQAAPPNYADAVNQLNRVLDITGGAQAGELADLLDEAQQELDLVQKMEELLEEVRAATNEKRWVDVLRKTSRLQRREVHARRYFRKAEAAIRELAASAVEQADWSTANRSIQALQAAGIDDNEIREWALRCERSDLLRRTSLLIEQGTLDELESAIAELDQFLADHPHDREATQSRRKARTVLLHQQAELATGARDFEAARGRLREALSLRPDPDVSKTLQAHLDRVSVELALGEADTRLRAGDAQAAGEALEQVLARGDPRVRARLEDVNAVKAALAEAMILEQRGDMIGAARALDEVLKRQSDFPPALARRKQLVTGLLDRGRQAEATGNLWAAREAYEMLREIAPQEHTNLDDMRRQLDGQMNDLVYRARQALENPDLEQAEIEGLLESLEAVPQTVRQARTTLNAYVPALHKLSDQVRTVDNMYQQARSAFDQAHRIGEDEYARIQHLLDAVRGVNGLFARRTRIRELQRSLDEHRMRRGRVAECIEEYRKWWVTWSSPVAPVGADFAAPVQAMLDEGTRSIDQAMGLNREIKSEDEKNMYGLRPWTDLSVRDPLDDEYDGLAKQKANLENIASLLLDGIKQREVGDGQSRQAQKLYEESTRDQDYRDAKALGEQAAQVYALALTSLQAAATQHAPLSTRARALVQDAAGLAEKVVRRRKEVEKGIEEAAKKVATMAELRTRAGESYGRREWFSALADYEEILKVNPRDSEAQKKRVELERRLREEDLNRARRQRYVVLGIVTGLVVVALSVTGWYFVAGPGRPVPTATPTPTLAITPGSITPPVEVTDMPTSTGTTTTLPPPIEHIFYSTPKPCIAARDTRVYQQPDEVGSVSQSLGAGKGFSAIGETGDGRWLIVQLPGYTDPVYIPAADAQCTP